MKSFVTNFLEMWSVVKHSWPNFIISGVVVTVVVVSSQLGTTPSPATLEEYKQTLLKIEEMYAELEVQKRRVEFLRERIKTMKLMNGEDLDAWPKDEIYMYLRLHSDYIYGLRAYNELVDGYNAVQKTRLGRFSVFNAQVRTQPKEALPLVVAPLSDNLKSN